MTVAPRLVRGLVLAALTGAVAGVLTWTFLAVYRESQQLVWQTLPDAVPALGDHPEITTVLLCVIGGLLVGLLRVRFSREPLGVGGALAELERPPRDSLGILGTAVVSLAGLAFGASLGPEAALIVVIGGLGSRILRIVGTELDGVAHVSAAGAVGALIGMPLAGAALTTDHASGRRAETVVAALVSGVVGLLTYRVISSGSAGFEPFSLPGGAASAGADTIAWALLAGLLGAMAGLLVAWAERPISRWVRSSAPTIVGAAVLAGLVLGAAGAIEPLLLFSGHEQTSELVDDLSAWTAGSLLVLAVIKVLLTVVMLAGGWVGGEIFPTIFAGVALGSALTELTSAPVSVAAAAAAGGAMAAALGRPILTVLLLAVLFPPDLLVPLTTGAAVGVVVNRMLLPQPSRTEAAPDAAATGR